MDIEKLKSIVIDLLQRIQNIEEDVAKIKKKDEYINDKGKIKEQYDNFDVKNVKSNNIKNQKLNNEDYYTDQKNNVSPNDKMKQKEIKDLYNQVEHELPYFNDIANSKIKIDQEIKPANTKTNKLLKHPISKSSDDLSFIETRKNNNEKKKSIVSPNKRDNLVSKDKTTPKKPRNLSSDGKNKKCLVLQCMHTKSVTSKNGLCSQHQATMERNTPSKIDYRNSTGRDLQGLEANQDSFVRDINTGVNIDLCQGKYNQQMNFHKHHEYVGANKADDQTKRRASYSDYVTQRSSENDRGNSTRSTEQHSVDYDKDGGQGLGNDNVYEVVTQPYADNTIQKDCQDHHKRSKSEVPQQVPQATELDGNRSRNEHANMARNDVFERLTNPKAYTGMYKTRFDQNGRGLGVNMVKSCQLPHELKDYADRSQHDIRGVKVNF